MFRSRPLPCWIAMPRQVGAASVALAMLATATSAQNAAAEETAPSTKTTLGQIDLNYDGLPPATVEVDLSQGMFTDLFGIGDAAIAGVAEALTKAAGSNGAAEGTQMAAEKLAAARQIVEIASQVVREVRVRVYQELPSDEDQPTKLMAHFSEVVRSSPWETIVRAREDENTVSVSVARDGGAIRGLFVVAYDGSDLVLANVVCDISPENAKKLTSVATKTGLEAGLAQVIEVEMRKLHQKSQGLHPLGASGIPARPVRPSSAPTPPRPPESASPAKNLAE